MFEVHVISASLSQKADRLAYRAARPGKGAARAIRPFLHVERAADCSDVVMKVVATPASM